MSDAPSGPVTALAFSSPYGSHLLNDQRTTAYEQLKLLEPGLEEGGLTPLGIPGFAGFFLAMLEEPKNRGGAWTIAINFAFGGDHGDVIIVARRGDVEIRRQGQPVDAAIEVFRESVAQQRAAMAA